MRQGEGIGRVGCGSLERFEREERASFNGYRTTTSARLFDCRSGPRPSLPVMECRRRDAGQQDNTTGPLQM